MSLAKPIKKVKHLFNEKIGKISKKGNHSQLQKLRWNME